MTRRQKKQLTRILVAAFLLLTAIVADKLFGGAFAPWQLLLLYLPAYLTAGLTVLKRAVQNILHGEVFDENLLMALATVGALSIGFLPTGTPEFAEAVFVMVFYQTGENEGFISFYAELDVADGNPDPTNNPAIIYNAETDTLYMTINYISFMVTIELSR